MLCKKGIEGVTGDEKNKSENINILNDIDPHFTWVYGNI